MKHIFTTLLVYCLGSLVFFPASSQSTLQTQLGSSVTIVVAKDGSGNYTTLQAAVNAIPNNSTTRKIIFVKSGTYLEKVEIPATKTNLCIVGEDASKTIISYNDYTGSGKIYNGIITSANGVAIGTSTSHTLYNAANDFSLMNITIQNTAGDVGQAVALNTNADRQFLYHCRLIGYQDTYYTWSDGRVYALDTYVEGAIDFIFGRGVALFDHCLIQSVRSNSYITAAATDQNFKYGYVFQNCKLTATSGISSVYLGRPWKAYGQTVFMNSEEGSFLNTGGWSIWSGTTNNTTCFYAEYKNCGSGAATGSRVSWSHQLTASEAANYTLSNLFDKSVRPSAYAANWLPTPSADNVYIVVNNNTDPFITAACFVSSSCTATVTAGSATTFCQGSSVTLTASTGNSYQWKKEGNNISNATAKTYVASTSGAYTVTVTDASGCVATTTALNVVVNNASTWYLDSDGDGIGSTSSTQSSCIQPNGYVASSGDLCPNDVNKVIPGLCGCGKSENSCIDCNGTVNGTAVWDYCSRCVGGTTSQTACASVGEAEIDACSFDGVTETKNTGYKGNAYINANNAVGAGISFMINAATDGNATVSFRYANGGSSNRAAQIVLNGSTLATTLDFPSTDSFTVWKTVEVTLVFKKGSNTLLLSSTTVDGLPNIDQIGYVSTGLSKASCVVTSISEDLPLSNLLVYPNPFDHVVNIVLPEVFEYSLHNSWGQEVQRGQAQQVLTLGQTLEAGIYLLRIETKGVTKLFKITKT